MDQSAIIVVEQVLITYSLLAGFVEFRQHASIACPQVELVDHLRILA